MSIDLAIAYLREKGLAGASKKAGRFTAEGLVECFGAADGSAAAIVELNCETDFVAKTEPFKALLASVGGAILAQPGSAEGGADDVAALKLATGQTVSESVQQAISSIGENRAFARRGAASAAMFTPAARSACSWP